MDPLVVQAAQQQMRRSAPDEHIAKRRKTDSDSVQSVARYNYASVESLQQGAEGFIVTCAFRREKSATKEAAKLLVAYLDLHHCSQLSHPHITSIHSSPDTAAAQEQPDSKHHSLSHTAIQPSSAPLDYTFSIIKLASSGIVMLQLQSQPSTHVMDKSPENNATLAASFSDTPNNNAATGTQLGKSADAVLGLEPKLPNSLPVRIVHQILDDIQAGTLASPEFCERIIPVQLTCTMDTQALKAAAERLAGLHAAEAVQKAQGAPVKFAVAYKGRGKVSKVKISASDNRPSTAAQGPGHADALDRGQAIIIVASAVEDAVKRCGGSVQVDLNNPQVVMIVEVLPMTINSIFALCWLPSSMTTATPRLTLKPLVSPQQPLYA